MPSLSGLYPKLDFLKKKHMIVYNACTAKHCSFKSRIRKFSYVMLKCICLSDVYKCYYYRVENGRDLFVNIPSNQSSLFIGFTEAGSIKLDVSHVKQSQTIYCEMFKNHP